MIWLQLAIQIILGILISGNFAKQPSWQKPGCHRVGNTRKISIPDCVDFKITTNACRGFCESYSIPSIPWITHGTLINKDKQRPLVSIGQCCNMMESEVVEKQVPCLDGIKTVTFKSALSCSCYHCKKD